MLTCKIMGGIWASLLLGIYWMMKWWRLRSPEGRICIGNKNAMGKKSKITVQGTAITILSQNEDDYISLIVANRFEN